MILFLFLFCYLISILVFFKSIILFVYISNVIPLLGYPSTHPSHPILPPLCLYEGAPPPTHPLLPHCSSIPLHWGIKPPQDQGAPLPLMPDKVILCYICSWSHGSFHVYSLVGGLVPGSSRGTGLLILLFFLWGCRPLQLLQKFQRIIDTSIRQQIRLWVF